MKKWLGAIAVLGLAMLVCLFVFNRSTRLDSTAPTGTSATTQLPGSPPVTSITNRAATSNLAAIQHNNPSTAAPLTSPVANVAPPVALPEPSVPPEELPQLSPQIVLENVRAAFRDFRSRFTSNPVGTNDEITRALNGENPGQTRFLRMEDGMRLNAKGELVDPWGTPYFFHQLSGKEMEIHSAGPDKTMWTSDDLVIK